MSIEMSFLLTFFILPKIKVVISWIKFILLDKSCIWLERIDICYFGFMDCQLLTYFIINNAEKKYLERKKFVQKICTTSLVLLVLKKSGTQPGK